MGGTELTALAERIESGPEVDAGLTADAIESLKAAFPEATQALRRDCPLLTSTDEALHVVHAIVPAWDISIKGVAVEPHGHWRCSLRESSALDEDTVIGIGRAPSLPRALIAALLRIAAGRSGT
jgi:hypothetical protein